MMLQAQVRTGFEVRDVAALVRLIAGVHWSAFTLIFAIIPENTLANFSEDARFD